MKQQTKFNTEQPQHAVEQQAAQNRGREFTTVEEMLRFDAAQTPPPPGIAQRLQKSAAGLPSPKAAWWKRFFGGAN